MYIAYNVIYIIYISKGKFVVCDSKFNGDFAWRNLSVIIHRIVIPISANLFYLSQFYHIYHSTINYINNRKPEILLKSLIHFCMDVCLYSTYNSTYILYISNKLKNNIIATLYADMCIFYLTASLREYATRYAYVLKYYSY